MSGTRGRICFVGLEAYPVLNPVHGHAGHGGEGVQQTLLARSFVDRGYDVHMVVLDHGQADDEVIDGIHIWKAYRPDAGIPIARFIYPRASGLLRALRMADAMIYYQSCAGAATGLTTWFCRRKGRRFVHRLASDTDCIPGRQIIRYARDRKLYEYGLYRADLILSQSARQQRLLLDNYGLSSAVAGMPVEPSEPLPLVERNIDVLWVANIRQLKRPGLVLSLAQRLPERRFHMAGGSCAGEEQLYSDLEHRASAIRNLQWSGFLPYRKAQSLFPYARVFLSTSETEGFPNTYLQAWMPGTPVVAFFDPDGIIEREGLGLVVRNEDEAQQAIENLLNDPALWQSLSRQARGYAMNYHGESVIDRYETLMAPLFRER